MARVSIQPDPVDLRGVTPTPDQLGMTITLPLDVWSRIVLAAKDSEDWKLRALIEQAVMEAIQCPAKRSP